MLKQVPLQFMLSFHLAHTGRSQLAFTMILFLFTYLFVYSFICYNCFSMRYKVCALQSSVKCMNGQCEVGFPTDNKNDSLPIKLGVSKNDPLNQEKVALLASLGLPASGSFMLVPGLHPISPGLLAFTRIFCMDKGMFFFC